MASGLAPRKQVDRGSARVRSDLLVTGGSERPALSIYFNENLNSGGATR